MGSSESFGPSNTTMFGSGFCTILLSVSPLALFFSTSIVLMLSCKTGFSESPSTVDISRMSNEYSYDCHLNLAGIVLPSSLCRKCPPCVGSQTHDTTLVLCDLRYRNHSHWVKQGSISSAKLTYEASGAATAFFPKGILLRRFDESDAYRDAAETT